MIYTSKGTISFGSATRQPAASYVAKLQPSTPVRRRVRRQEMIPLHYALQLVIQKIVMFLPWKRFKMQLFAWVLPVQTDNTQVVIISPVVICLCLCIHVYYYIILLMIVILEIVCMCSYMLYIFVNNKKFMKCIHSIYLTYILELPLCRT